MDENSLAQLYDDYNDGINVLEGESVTDYITRMGGVNYNSKADGGIMVAIENFNQGGMAGNKTYHQFHDQYVPMDEESMGYAYGGGVGSMMQPRQNFAVGGGADYFEPLGYDEDTSLEVEDFTPNNSEFMITAADALPNQTGTIRAVPKIMDKPGVTTIENSAMDKFDRPITMRDIAGESLPFNIENLGNPNNDPRVVSEELGITGYGKPDMRAVAGEETMPFDRDYSLFDQARMGQQDLEITDRNRGQIIERTPSTPFDRGFTIRDVAGELPARFDGRFDPSQGDIPYSPNNRFSRYDKFDGSEMLEGVGIDGKPEGYETNRFGFDPSQGNAPLTGMKEFYPDGMTYEQLVDLGLAGEDQDVGLTALDLEKQRSRNPFGKIMEFMGNIPTPFNLARKGLGAVGNFLNDPERRANLTGYSTQADYDRARSNRQKKGRIDTLNKTIARQSKKGTPSQTLIDRRERLQNEITSTRKSGTGNTYTGSGKSGMGRDTSQGGGDTGASSGKIVCTMMNNSYGFGSFRNKIWLKHSRDLPKEYEVGYHTIFLPLVKFAKGEGKLNKVVKKILEHIARHRTYDLKQEMKGKTHLLGRAYRKVLEPICYLAGKIKSIFS